MFPVCLLDKYRKKREKTMPLGKKHLEVSLLSQREKTLCYVCCTFLAYLFMCFFLNIFLCVLSLFFSSLSLSLTGNHSKSIERAPKKGGTPYVIQEASTKNKERKMKGAGQNHQNNQKTTATCNWDHLGNRMLAKFPNLA